MKKQRRKAEIPQSPVRLPGTLWGVVAYFNPTHSPVSLANLNRFSNEARRQGLKLLIVELTFNNSDSEVTDEVGDLVVHLSSDTMLWHKERLLNIGVEALPPECDKVAWLDGDIIFENPDWVAQTIHLLDSYMVLQLFERACWLGPGQFEAPSDCPVGLSEGHCMPGIAFNLPRQPNRRRALGDYFQHGHTGFAWAARRSLLDKHGLYDRSVIGGGDVNIAHAIYNDEDFFRGLNYFSCQMTMKQMNSITQWGRQIGAEVCGSVGHVPGRVLHLFHGKLSGRSYDERMKILKESDYDPASDIAVDEDGCLRWNSDKPELHRRVADYLVARNAATV